MNKNALYYFPDKQPKAQFNFVLAPSVHGVLPSKLCFPFTLLVTKTSVNFIWATSKTQWLKLWVLCRSGFEIKVLQHELNIFLNQLWFGSPWWKFDCTYLLDNLDLMIISRTRTANPTLCYSRLNNFFHLSQDHQKCTPRGNGFHYLLCNY